MKKNAFYIIFLIISLIAKSFAQEKGFILKNITQEDGLPSTETYFIFEDSEHYLWFATDKGVVRFDGKTMQQYALPDNVVFKIFEDKKGKIWFFSYSGRIAYFEKNNIYPYKYNDVVYKTIGGIGVNDAYIDENENITISSKAEFNYFINNKGKVTKELISNSLLTDYCVQFEIKKVKEGYYSSLRKHDCDSKKDIINILLDVDKKITNFNLSIPNIHHAFSHINGCSIIDKDNILLFFKNVLIRFNTKGQFVYKKLDADIVCLNVNKDKIFVGMYNQGVTVLDTSLIYLYGIKNLKDFTVSSIITDYEGGMWFSTTEKGVFYSKNLNIEVYEKNESDRLPNFRMCKLNDSVFVTGNTKGIYTNTAKGTSQLILPYPFRNLTSLILENPNRLLIGCCDFIKNNKLNTINENLGYMPNINKSLIRIAATTGISITKDSYLTYEGTQLIETDKKTLNVKRLLKYFRVNTTYLDNKNKLWLGNLNGLYQFDTIENIAIPIKASSSLFKTGISRIKQMENGIYVVGVKFGGIVLMKDTNVVATITTKNGLLSDAVSNVFTFNNQLWVVTSIGLSVVQFTDMNKMEFTIHHIGKNMGFNNFIVNQLMPFQNKILAATSQGIYAINNPDELIKDVVKQLPFYITSISFNKSDTTYISNFSIPYNNNRIKIKYTAISNNSPGDIIYYYRFVSNGNKWQSTLSSELFLENLAPGEYHFEIYAAINGQRRKSNIKTLHFTVSTPWYGSLLFWIIIIFLTGAFTFLWFKYRLDKIREKNEQSLTMSKKIADLEQTALRSQLNPHFIFNCLTSIQHLVVSGKSIEANEYLVKFARLIRKTLILSEHSFIHLSEEIDYLTEYMVLEQLRVPGQFDFSFDVDDKIDLATTTIPNMMLQPLIENSIRHGIKPLINKKGMIKIKMVQQGKFIFCSVIDNGVGVQHTSEKSFNPLHAHKSFGIGIIKKRLEIINEHDNTKVVFNVNNLFDANCNSSGTEVVICLPFKISTK